MPHAHVGIVDNKKPSRQLVRPRARNYQSHYAALDKVNYSAGRRRVTRMLERYTIQGTFHSGTADSSVSCNTCIPLCSYNLANMIRTRRSFLEVTVPDDFERYTHGEREREHEGPWGTKEKCAVP